MIKKKKKKKRQDYGFPLCVAAAFLEETWGKAVSLGWSLVGWLCSGWKTVPLASHDHPLRRVQQGLSV